MELAYQIWETSQTKEDHPHHLVVLLHGMGGTGALWRPVAAALEDDVAILAPDQRGHGKSRVPEAAGSRVSVGYTPLDYGRDVLETMRATHFTPAWIVGHSMGVRTACAAAHLDPSAARGLVLVDLGFSGVAGGGLGDDLGSFLRKLPTEFASRDEARAFMAAECPDPAIAQYLMAVSARAPSGSPDEGCITFPFDHGALIRTIQAARDVPVREWVRELGGRGLPILVLRGATSLVWTHEEFVSEQQAMRDLPSVVFEEFAGAGHGLPFEKRLEFVARLRQFMGLKPR